MRILASLALVPGLVLAQTATPTPARPGDTANDQTTFDAASVRVSTPITDSAVLWSLTCHGGPGTPDPERFTCDHQSLKVLVSMAYNVQFSQVSGPDWLGPTQYDIIANVPAGSSREQFRVMFQNLLVERFRLKARQEKKDVDGFDLVVGKSGLRVKPSRAEEPASPSITTSMTSPLMVATGRKQKFASLARYLSNALGQPVEDQTGEAGEYDIVLEFVNPQLLNSVSAGPSIFTALGDKLGLSLKARKITVERLLVESADRVPTAN
jgi:uncharacterized protein (TIGR03435 family)